MDSIYPVYFDHHSESDLDVVFDKNAICFLFKITLKRSLQVYFNYKTIT